MDPYQQPGGQSPGPPALVPEPQSSGGLGTGAKIGIGIGIGCLVTVLAAGLILLFMGACTCSACSSCCEGMTQMAQKQQEIEEREAAKLREVGETVQFGHVSMTISDAQRQGETVVITADVENTSFDPVSIGPEMFKLSDSNAESYSVDADKAAMTLEGIQDGQSVESNATITTRAVFTVPAQSTGLVLEVKAPEYGYTKRRFKLGL
ncbi:MAG: DUF4352 domain-containing protein [Deltaproteobacteria bacterium]|nr:DUF4352 domain-containing protein [Deltaproteobacteria bacterium]